MKKILSTLLLALITLTGCNHEENTLIRNDKAYLFYSQTCPHCHHAQEYIGKRYPNLDIIKMDVATPKGREMLNACAKKFNLNRNVGIPLFCLVDNHLMGWSDKSKIKFDAYIRPYLKK